MREVGRRTYGIEAISGMLDRYSWVYARLLILSLRLFQNLRRNSSVDGLDAIELEGCGQCGCDIELGRMTGDATTLIRKRLTENIELQISTSKADLNSPVD